MTSGVLGSFLVLVIMNSMIMALYLSLRSWFQLFWAYIQKWLLTHVVNVCLIFLMNLSTSPPSPSPSLLFPLLYFYSFIPSPIYLLIDWVNISLCCPDWHGTHYTNRAGFKPKLSAIPLLLPPECQDWRRVKRHLPWLHAGFCSSCTIPRSLPPCMWILISLYLHNTCSFPDFVLFLFVFIIATVICITGNG